MGVKTKTQLLAERQVLRQLITAVVAASSDKDLQPQGMDYAVGICRHFALLFAAGASAPMPSVSGGADASCTARMSSLKELDPYLFLDALVEARVNHTGRSDYVVEPLGLLMSFICIHGYFFVAWWLRSPLVQQLDFLLVRSFL